MTLLSWVYHAHSNGCEATDSDEISHAGPSSLVMLVYWLPISVLAREALCTQFN